MKSNVFSADYMLQDSDFIQDLDDNEMVRYVNISYYRFYDTLCI